MHAHSQRSSAEEQLVVASQPAEIVDSSSAVTYPASQQQCPSAVEPAFHALVINFAPLCVAVMQGMFLHVTPVEPTTSYDCSVQVPWWKDITLRVSSSCQPSSVARLSSTAAAQGCCCRQAPAQQWLRPGGMLQLRVLNLQM
jgi:hypothetical protein